MEKARTKQEKAGTSQEKARTQQEKARTSQEKERTSQEKERTQAEKVRIKMARHPKMARVRAMALLEAAVPHLVAAIGLDLVRASPAAAVAVTAIPLTDAWQSTTLTAANLRTEQQVENDGRHRNAEPFTQCQLLMKDSTEKPSGMMILVISFLLQLQRCLKLRHHLPHSGLRLRIALLGNRMEIFHHGLTLAANGEQLLLKQRLK